MWGGLWCLPSIDKATCPLTYIQQHYSLEATNFQPLMQFKHRFSHFHLEIEAIKIETPTKQAIAEAAGQWLPIQQLPSLGLAKPTTHILESLITK